MAYRCLGPRVRPDGSHGSHVSGVSPPGSAQPATVPTYADSDIIRKWWATRVGWADWAGAYRTCMGMGGWCDSAGSWDLFSWRRLDARASIREGAPILRLGRRLLRRSILHRAGWTQGSVGRTRRRVRRSTSATAVRSDAVMSSAALTPTSHAPSSGSAATAASSTERSGAAGPAPAWRRRGQSVAWA